MMRPRRTAVRITLGTTMTATEKSMSFLPPWRSIVSRGRCGTWMALLTFIFENKGVVLVLSINQISCDKADADGEMLCDLRRKKSF